MASLQKKKKKLSLFSVPIMDYLNSTKSQEIQVKVR